MLPLSSDRSSQRDQSALIGPSNILDKSYIIKYKKENTQNSLDSEKLQEIK